ncbi:MAG: FtsX-like permease family protein [Pirellulales bacterium]
MLLVGYLPESVQSHHPHDSAMGYAIEAGDVYVGHELASGLNEGDALDVLGRKFRVAKVLPEQGSTEDIMLAMNLADAQELLDRQGKVNQILALGCRCAGERLPKIRAQLSQSLPDTKITEFRSIAVGRAEQRDAVRATRQAMLAETAANHEEIITQEREGRDALQSRMEGFAAIVMPVGVLTAAVLVGLLVLANVRERRVEIGLLRALGKGSMAIATLFLSKAVLLGLLGGVIGFVGGALAAREIAGLLGVAAGQLPSARDLLPWAILGAPVVCALAAYLPTLSAIVEDPAIVLRDS